MSKKKTKKTNSKQKKQNNKKRTILIILLGVLLIIAILVGVALFIRYKKLDGRECMTCPYVYDLTTKDIEILDKKLNGYNAEVELGTGISDVKIDGTVYLEYDCNTNYCFSSSYLGTNCSWNYPSSGTIKYTFNEDYEVSEDFSVKPYNTPTSIYMYRNHTECEFNISEVSGKLKIYGERVR